MTQIGPLHRALVDRILGGGGTAPPGVRRAAFDDAGLDERVRTLVDKVASGAYRVTDDDIAATLAAGLTEDQVFELVVCAAVGEATRQYENGLAALDAATGEA